MGSKGGYSRVGPGKQEVANQYGKKYGYTAAQVTSYLERGHAVPSPTGKSQRYRPNLEKAILGSAGNAVVPSSSPARRLVSQSSGRKDAALETLQVSMIAPPLC